MILGSGQYVSVASFDSPCSNWFIIAFPLFSCLTYLVIEFDGV